MTLAEQTVTRRSHASATTTSAFNPGTFRPVTQIERAPFSSPGGLAAASHEWVDRQFCRQVVDSKHLPDALGAVVNDEDRCRARHLANCSGNLGQQWRVDTVSERSDEGV